MEQYRFSEQQRALLERLQEPFAIFQMVDDRIVTLVVSDGFCELLGVDSHAEAYEAMNRDTYKNVYPDDVTRLAHTVFRFVRDGDKLETIYRLKRRDGGGYRVIHAMGKHVYLESGVRLAHVWYTDEGDYTERSGGELVELSRSLSNALHEESILNASRFDYLTGLPSMTYFFELAETARTRIREAGGRPVLLYMDLGGMKYFNTRFGFAEGDKLLRAFARVLALRFESVNCSHFGADHFVAVTREEGLEDALKALFSECAAMNGGNTLPVRVGVYVAQSEAVHVSTACDRAKIACDVIKSAYTSTFHYYDRELQEDAERRQYILANLDRAISEKWIQVYYQPIIRAVNNMVSDDEALSRWIDPARGFLSPAEFIPILEDAGVIYRLDLYVLEQVLEKIKLFEERGITVVPQSINLSRSDFDACDIVEEIRKRVDAAGVRRDKITIEITESVIGSDFDFMKTQVSRFQALGFPVWMDDFGSGYSSLDVLQSIKFDLIKFDMSFMRRLDEGDSGRIILTELMKMATALGIDTVCEGVETEAQVRFLQEIGCSKLQGFYFEKPNPLSHLLDWKNGDGKNNGYENLAEASYYEAIGCVNLYDLAVIASEGDSALMNAFNTLPMCIIEVKGDSTRFIRSNQSYRDFAKRFFDFDISNVGPGFRQYDAAFMRNVVRTCCEQGLRSFYDEKMPDGSVVHSFARRICVNPVSGSIAVVIAVLSVSDPDEGATYADIARALAADYYNIYVIDLDTERFIEYTSPVGQEEMALERHGEDFFAAVRRDTMTRIYEADRAQFLASFTKEKLIRELDAHGVFTATYRLIDTGKPMYASMKVTRMAPGGNRIIMGISIIDAQMRQRQHIDQIMRERDTLARMMVLSEDYLSLYTIDPDTGEYVEYSATSEYESLGFAKEGKDFFHQGVVDGMKTVHPDDLPKYLRQFTRDNVMKEIRENNVFMMHYRLVINGAPKPVSLRIARYVERGEEKLVAGVRAWKARRNGTGGAEG